MKTLELDFEQRAKLTGSGKSIGGIIGIASGSLGKMEALGSIYALVRFSDEEANEMVVTELANGASSCVPPTPQWGTKTVELEDLWVTALREELGMFTQYTIQDTQAGSWLRRLQAQLAAK